MITSGIDSSIRSEHSDRPIDIIDGGLLVEPYETQTLLVAPGERYEVLVELASSTDELARRTLHYDRGHNIPDPGPIDILRLTVGAPGRVPGPLPTSWGIVEPIPFDANTPRRRFVLQEDDTVPAMPVFTINDEVFPDITPVKGSMGQIEIWQRA